MAVFALALLFFLLGNVTHLRYDSLGDVTSVIDAQNNETDTSYNIAYQPVQVTFPATGQSGSNRGYQTIGYLYTGGPATSSTTYDESGDQVAEVSFGYDQESMPVSVSGSAAPSTFAYNAYYQPTSVTDGNGHTTTYSYDTAGYPSEVVYPGATSTNQGSSDTVTYPFYDADGNLLTRVDGNNVSTYYTYADPESLLTKIHYPGGQLADVAFTYDSYDRTATESDGVGSHVYSYDDLDNLLSDTTSFTGGPSNQTISYTMYPDGSRETMATPAGTFSYAYDGDSRPASVTNPFSETTSWGYYNNSWLNTQTLGNGATTTYSYNALGQLTDLANKTSGSTTLSEFSSLLHDGAGDLTSQTASVPAYTAYSGSTSYTYDSISGIGTRGQLTEEASTRNGSYTNTFAYDGGSYTGSQGVGNPTTFRGNANTFNSDNQLTDTGFAYDGNGNQTAAGSTSLSYDPENRLTAYGSALSASYNGYGLRAVKTDSTGATYYLYDGPVPVVEENSSGTVTATNTFGADGLVSRNAGGTSTFYTFDPEGNTAQRLDSSQNVLASDIYDSFGAGASSGTPTDPFGYGAQWGYYTDRSTGLILCTNRYYNPGQGQWLTRDPIGYAGGINLYGYVGNGPVNAADPLGLEYTLWDTAFITFMGMWGTVEGAELGGVLGLPEGGVGAVPGVIGGGVVGGAAGLTLGRYLDRMAHGGDSGSGGGGSDTDAGGGGSDDSGLPQGSSCPNPAVDGGDTAAPRSAPSGRPGAGSDLPIRGGPPNGSLSNDLGGGNGTIRDYDANGNAMRDNDFGHDHGNVGDPHIHNWDWSGPKPVRGIPLPVPHGE